MVATRCFGVRQVAGRPGLLGGSPVPTESHVPGSLRRVQGPAVTDQLKGVGDHEPRVAPGNRLSDGHPRLPRLPGVGYVEALVFPSMELVDRQAHRPGLDRVADRDALSRPPLGLGEGELMFLRPVDLERVKWSPISNVVHGQAKADGTLDPRGIEPGPAPVIGAPTAGPADRREDIA